MVSREDLKLAFVGFIRTVLAGILIAAIITGVLILGFRGQTNEERRVQQQTLFANLAQACVLALPVDPEAGRDASDVAQCFTQYGLQPPGLAHDAP